MVAVLLFLALQLIGQVVARTVVFVSTESTGIEAVSGTPDSATSWSLACTSVLTIVSLLSIKSFGLRRRLTSMRIGGSDAVLSATSILLVILSGTIMVEFLETGLDLRLPPEYVRVYESVVHHPVGLVAVCFLGPLCEELVFRGGIMTPMLRRGVNPWWPICVSSLIFGLVHGNPPQMIYAVMVGFALAMVYYHTGSLVIPILCHILNNLVTVALMLSKPDGGEFQIETVIGLWPAVVAMTLSLVIAIVMIRRMWQETPADLFEE